MGRGEICCPSEVRTFSARRRFDLACSEDYGISAGATIRLGGARGRIEVMGILGSGFLVVVCKRLARGWC